MNISDKIDEKTLILRIKKKWFDLILIGEKKEEYRKIKKYYTNKFKKKYNKLLLINGYSKNSPQILIELNEIKQGFPNKKWSFEDDKCFILKLGKILYKNIQLPKKEYTLF